MKKLRPLRKRKDDPSMYHRATNRDDAVQKLKTWVSQDNEIGFLLVRAVRHNDLQMAQVALENGADPNYQNVLAESPLKALCDKGDLKMLELLLKYGLSMGHDQFGEPPLIRAVFSERLDLIPVFVKAGADVNAHENHSLGTALHAAAGTRLGPKIVRLLLDLGADPREVSASGKNALESARSGHELFGDTNPAVFEILEDALKKWRGKPLPPKPKRKPISKIEKMAEKVN